MIVGNQGLRFYSGSFESYKRKRIWIIFDFVFFLVSSREPVKLHVLPKTYWSQMKKIIPSSFGLRFSKGGRDVGVPFSVFLLHRSIA